MAAGAGTPPTCRANGMCTNYPSGKDSSGRHRSGGSRKAQFTISDASARSAALAGGSDE